MVGNVTIATNMAGRGTDIKLAKEAHAAGGLHVIGTERHTARRIDNQLRGRGGRQGDPGSSRFYVSLQDDLMKMFAGEWTIKVLGFLGMEEGMAIEDKRISKGILRAQKKVEERNFLARKNLLEYDEVMDHQRTNFYRMRQQVLLGTGVADVIWTMIGQAIEDAVEKYVVEDFVAATVAEWARVNFDVMIDPADLKGIRRIQDLEDFIKNTARTEVETNLGVVLQEYMGEDPEDPNDWDTKGLASWAMSKYQVQVSQSQLRKMNQHSVEQMLKEAALEQIGKRDVNGLTKYLEPDYSMQALCDWAKDKFNIDVTPKELIADPTRHIPKQRDEIVALIEERARAAYIPRETEYPIDHAMTFAFGDASSTEINPYGVDYIRAWAKAKYGADISAERIRDMSLRKLRDELIEYQDQWLNDGQLDKEVDAILDANREPIQIAKAANARFAANVVLDPSDGQLDMTKVREQLIEVGRAFLRKELTDLEQFVLIQIFDQSWKDHLYAMDMLKTGIGLQAFAEKDPRIAYKKEGYAYFEQMMEGIRDKVTDLIFRARIGRAAPEPRSNYKISEAKHEVSQNYGVSENLRETADVGVPNETAAAAGEVQGEGAVKVKQIVRDAPKVGRNDPCPCGSGKKYKKCCGVNAE
jgi:preprotein translocase subunit SecA